MEGWISLYRKFVEWEWYQDVNVKIVFIHLLLLANHRDNKWQGKIIKRGQLITSSEHLAEDLGLSRQQVRTALNKLKSTNEITIKSTNKYMLVTIEKYEKYQDNNLKITSEITDKITNEQPTNNQQITTNNNDNKEINNICPSNEGQPSKEDILLSDFEQIWNIYPRKEGKNSAFSHYKSWIKGKKYAGKTMKLNNKQMWYAVKKYADEVKNIEKKYIKMGSSFFNEKIMDYVEVENE